MEPVKSPNLGAQRPQGQSHSHPPTRTVSSTECYLRPAPFRRFSETYENICVTHKRLVRSGLINCSIPLSISPPDIEVLPSAPLSPIACTDHQGSVHWGAIGQFSGVATPDSSFEFSAETPYNSKGNLLHRKSSVTNPNSSVETYTNTTDNLLHRKCSVTNPNSSVESYNNTTDNLLHRKFSVTNPNILDSSMSLNSLNNTGVGQSADDMFRQKVKKLKDARRALIREMSEFEPDDVCASRLQVIESELAAIKKSKNDYQDSVEDFVEEYTGRLDDPSILESWKKDVVDIGKKVKSHAKSIRDKREELFPDNATAQKSLKIQEALLLLQQQTLEEKQKSNAEKIKDREADVRCLADEEKNLFFGECSVLEDIMPDEDWTVVDDDVISQNMRSLSKWQEQWCQLERAYRKYENLSLRHLFPQVDKDAVKAKYDDLRDRFDNTKELLQKEDSTVRGLYTLEPIRSDIIKYPTFSGAQSEDYIKFREIMEVRFRENKIKKREQVSKLRECLKGAALARVPDGVKDIEEAFKRLQEAFGNPSKLMAFQLKALEDLGTLPSEKLPSAVVSIVTRKELNGSLSWKLSLARSLSCPGEVQSLHMRPFHPLLTVSFGAGFLPMFLKNWLRFLVKMKFE